jgi:CheY-like chemotaxis protein
MIQRPKVLIVDDEPFNVDYLEQQLEDSNYELITASNGREALDKIQSEQPDLVLLDLMMPILDGFAVLAQVTKGQLGAPAEISQPVLPFQPRRLRFYKRP